MFRIATPKRRFDANKISLGGIYPYVVRTSENNGIKGYITKDAVFLNNGNTISFGQDTATIFYQKYPYFTGDKIKILSYEDTQLNETIATYLLTSMRKAFSNFSWGSSSYNVEILKNVKILLPVSEKGSIDYQYIEERIRELEEERVHELEAYLREAGFEDCILTPSEIDALRIIAEGKQKMQRFAIIEKFNVANTHNILKSDVVFNSGITPYVTASEGNNSIVSYISYKKDMIEKGNSIMIGGKTLVITYQPRDFFSNDSHNLVLTINDKAGHNESAQLYMVAALYKTLGPKYSWGDSISKAKIKNDGFYLPVTSDGNTVDYAFMSTYVSAIKKQCIAALKLEISREHHACEQAVGINLDESKTESEEDKTIVLPEYHEGCVPLYSVKAACGKPDYGESSEKKWVDASGHGFKVDPKRHFAVYAKGNSMLPKIKDGDICVFEWYNEVGGSRNGEIVLIQCHEYYDPDYGGHYTIKKFKSEKKQYEDGSWEHTTIELIPLNPDFDVIKLEEDSEYRTLGVFKCVLRS